MRIVPPAGGTSFSLMTYQEAQPRAVAIKDAVLSRRMPPWGAVKGFGDFRNDQGLTQEQISLITDWVEGGRPKATIRTRCRRAEVPRRFRRSKIREHRRHQRRCPLDRDRWRAYIPSTSDGSFDADSGCTAGWRRRAIIWLYEFRDSARHPFLFRKPLEFPSQTVIRGVASDATIFFFPHGGHE